MKKLILIILLSPLCLRAEDAQPAVRLNNDAKYEARLKALLAAPPAAGAEPVDRLKYLQELAYAEHEMRHNDKAEAVTRQLMKESLEWSWSHLDLSIFLGKQGKYKDAEAEAKRSLEMNPEFVLANLVVASWEWHLGKRDEAHARIKSVPRPAGGRDLEYYYGCRACFYASVGDEEKIEENIRERLKVAPDKSAFFERDVNFDRYRNKAWFIKLVGKTLLEVPEK